VTSSYLPRRKSADRPRRCKHPIGTRRYTSASHASRSSGWRRAGRRLARCTCSTRHTSHSCTRATASRRDRTLASKDRRTKARRRRSSWVRKPAS
jgi:hypothetical protein